MSPKKAILQALQGASSSSAAPSPVRPPSIPGYADRPERFQRAVNELLQARLVEGRKDADGHMTIALNQHRREEIERILRPLWTRPGVWAGVAAVVALSAWLVV